MSRFFTNSPYADTYDNAVDKSDWLKETCRGSYDWRTPKDAPQYTMADVERSDKLIEAGAPGSMCPVSAGGTHVSQHDVVQLVLDDLITTAESQQSQQPATAPEKPVTCELITCIEAGFCECCEPFKAVTAVGRKWAAGGCREWAQTKVHSAAWQRE
eukprot:SAG25_NODE_1070_length_4122_cov_46.303256_2_plen_157_part_00